MGLTQLGVTQGWTVSPSLIWEETSDRTSWAEDKASSPQRTMKRLETFSILEWVPVGKQGRDGSLRESPQSLDPGWPQNSLDSFYRWGHWGSERRHTFPHSTEQEMEGPAQGFTTHILCPRDLDVQLFLQGHSLPQWSSDCLCERLYKVVVTRL